MWTLTHRVVVKAAVVVVVTALWSGAVPLRAQTAPPSAAVPGQTIDREAALQRAASLRAEAAAHREMEREFALRRPASRRERRWNARVVDLCRQYAADSETAATAYEALAAQAPRAGSDQPTAAGEHAIVAPPSTAEEYKARATQYEQRAAEFRADADRHAAMIAGDPRTINVQPYRGGSLPPRPVMVESPRDRDMRQHCIEIVQRSTDLARDAEDFAKHYRLRAGQLEGGQVK